MCKDMNKELDSCYQSPFPQGAWLLIKIPSESTWEIETYRWKCLNQKAWIDIKITEQKTPPYSQIMPSPNYLKNHGTHETPKTHYNDQPKTIRRGCNDKETQRKFSKCLLVAHLAIVRVQTSHVRKNRSRNLLNTDIRQIHSTVFPARFRAYGLRIKKTRGGWCWLAPKETIWCWGGFFSFDRLA